MADTDITDKELRRMNLIENVHRKNLSDTQKARSIEAIYADLGYSREEVLKLLRRLELDTHGRKLKKLGNKKPINTDFLDACKAIGYSPTYQANLLEMLRLDPDILEVAEKERIPLVTKAVLANSKLFKKKDKVVQKAIVARVAQYKHEPSRARRQIESDLEVLEKDDNRDVVLMGLKTPKPEDHSDKLKLARDAGVAMDRVMSLSINKKLPCSSFKKEDIDSKDARANMLAIIKAIGDTRQLNGFDQQLKVLSHMIRITQEIIDDVTATYERQEDIFRP